MFRRGYTLRTNKEASLDGSFKNGDVAQLGEHRLCKPGVEGSIPFVSTLLVYWMSVGIRQRVKRSETDEPFANLAVFSRPSWGSDGQSTNPTSSFD